MPKRPAHKECIDVRICVDQETNQEINKYQARRIAKDGLSYQKFEAASDYFMELVKKDKNLKKE